MYHVVPRARARAPGIISPENTKIPQSNAAGPRWVPKARAGGGGGGGGTAGATEFHEDRRTATMNISPGPRIIIRNEIALESLISRRARPALGIRARATSAEGDDCDFSRRESSPVRIARRMSALPRAFAVAMTDSAGGERILIGRAEVFAG